MNIKTKKWHRIHTKNIREREATHTERLRRWRLGLTRRKLFPKHIHMKVPAQMDMFANYEETIQFINQIKNNVLTKGRLVFLDFSTCEAISAETCVILAAEIDRCRKIKPESINGTYPSEADVYFMLNELGFFSWLGIKSTKPVFDDVPEVDVVQLASGTSADKPEIISKGMKELFQNNNKNHDENYSGNVWRALSEATINAVEHAYPESFINRNLDTCISQWWRAGFRDYSKNDVVMVFYDQGAGIPGTITEENKTLAKKLSEFKTIFSREPDDKEKIELAMERGRSRTKVPGRGQGSYDMQKIIRESTDATFEVFSYQGKYHYQSSGEWRIDDAITSLQGTLLVWKICLNTKKCGNNEN